MSESVAKKSAALAIAGQERQVRYDSFLPVLIHVCSMIAEAINDTDYGFSDADSITAD